MTIDTSSGSKGRCLCLFALNFFLLFLLSGLAVATCLRPQGGRVLVHSISYSHIFCSGRSTIACRRLEVHGTSRGFVVR
jgi:hypothetical protein